MAVQAELLHNSIAKLFLLSVPPLSQNLVAFDPMARAKRAIDFASMTARDMILAHTVNGTYFIEDISNEQLLKTDLPGANIRINIYPRGPMAATVRDQSHAEHPYRYTANCAPLLKLNRVADRGIVHVVDRVLVPARNTLMDIIEVRDDMTLMRTFLEMTGLDKMLREQGDDKHYTIFAPNDDAFLKLDKDIRRKLKAGNGCAMSKCSRFPVLYISANVYFTIPWWFSYFCFYGNGVFLSSFFLWTSKHESIVYGSMTNCNRRLRRFLRWPGYILCYFASFTITVLIVCWRERDENEGDANVGTFCHYERLHKFK